MKPLPVALIPSRVKLLIKSALVFYLMGAPLLADQSQTTVHLPLADIEHAQQDISVERVIKDLKGPWQGVLHMHQEFVLEGCYSTIEDYEVPLTLTIEDPGPLYRFHAKGRLLIKKPSVGYTPACHPDEMPTVTTFLDTPEAEISGGGLIMPDGQLAFDPWIGVPMHPVRAMIMGQDIWAERDFRLEPLSQVIGVSKYHLLLGYKGSVKIIGDPEIPTNLHSYERGEFIRPNGFST